MKKAREKEELRPAGTVVYTWEGEISDFRMLDVRMEDIVTIQKIGDRLYSATVLAESPA